MRHKILDKLGPNYCADTSLFCAEVLCSNPFKGDSLPQLLACLLVERGELYEGTYIGAASITKAHKVFREVFSILVMHRDPTILNIEDVNHRAHYNLHLGSSLEEDAFRDDVIEKHMKQKSRTMKYTKAAIRFLRLRGILADRPMVFPWLPFYLNWNRLEELFNILDVDPEKMCEKNIKYGSTRIKKTEIRSVERALTPDQRTTLHRDFWEPKPIPKYVALKKKAASKEVADKRGFSDSEQERYLIYLEERIDRIQDRYASAIARLDAVEKALNLQRGEG